MKGLHILAFLVIIIEAVNIGLWGTLRLNLVESLFSNFPAAINLFYILVGISGVYIGLTHVKNCRICSKMKN